MAADTKLMKWSMTGKRLLAAASIAATALTLTSCGPGNTVDFVYVTSNRQNPGQVDAYVVNSLTGALVKLLDSPYPSGGRNPVYDVTSPDGKYLYVANHDDNTLVMFAIGPSDGKLYPLQTVNTPGTEPVALAMSPDGATLYALDYYAPATPGHPSFTDLNPGPGAVVAFPVDKATGRMGTPLSVGAANYWQVQCFPSNLTVTPDGTHLYVANTNAVLVTTSPPVTGTVPKLPATCPTSGTVSAFAIGGSGAAPLTEIGSPISTGGGSEPTGIIADPAGKAVYVTDAALNLLYTYTVQSDGSLTLGSTVATGTQPMGAAVVSGTSGNKFLYVTNFSAGTISSYSLASGAPVPIATTNAGSSGPLCILVEPELQRFIYTSDYIGGFVGGAQVDPANGTLILNQNSPYPGSGQPTCVAAVTHARGRHNGL